MKRTYECMLLLDNREVRNGWDAVKTHVSGLFGKHGGEVKSARLWDERRLSYPISHQHRGTYLLVYAEVEPDNLTGLRRDLQFDEKVLRDMFLACPEIPPEAFEPEPEFDHSTVQVEDDTRSAKVAPADAPAPDGAEAPPKTKTAEAPPKTKTAETPAEPAAKAPAKPADAPAEPAAAPAEPAATPAETSEKKDEE